MICRKSIESCAIIKRACGSDAGAGAFDTSIELQRMTGGRDAAGGEIANWSKLKTVWAIRSDVSDGEKWRSGQMSATRLSRFIIRYDAALADLDARDRLLLDGGIWGIVGVKVVERRALLEITAEVRGEGLRA
jgi:SPP1 family predicted phage head-tail adaptor